MNPRIIHPVVMAVPEADQQLKGREKVKSLRRVARKALEHCARYSGVVMGTLEKDDRGAPLPSNGIYWSLTHKERYVAAVASASPVGIDIERDRPCSEALYQRIAENREWELAPQVTQALFYRYWTAKEAVLKAMGEGLTGLSRCRIAKILDDTRLELTYDGVIWRVRHMWYDDHIVTITDNGIEIQWHRVV